ncbi:MAG: fibronectin type III domain-containing protein [Phycisphaerae bacterium]|nr:fibronectin type III domain-containing protein [Phycisphaerae bacterium]
MAKPRIATKPTDLRDQLTQALAGITNEASWPATAPPAVAVSAAQNVVATAITTVEDLKAQLAQARATLHTNVDTGIGLMKQIDSVTDGLYGPDDPRKENFGLPPKKTSHGPSVPLGQVLITKIEDGTAPVSIFVDWDPDAGASAYQIEWYTDAAMSQQIGAAAVSASEHEIQGLTQGQQYWVHVRSVRGNEYGQWSDPATRVANL